MESWRRIWRTGLEPLLSDVERLALRLALETDDPRLIQGSTIDPIPVALFRDFEICGACAVAFPLWQAGGLTRVGDLHQAFQRRCAEAHRRLGESAGVAPFLNWFDETPRSSATRELLRELDRERRRAA